MTELRKVTILAWRKLLLSEYGIEGLLVARENAPKVANGESHNIIFQSGKAEGWKECLEYLQNFIAVEKVKVENLENP